MADDHSEESSTLGYDVAIALLYALAVGVNVYLIVDTLTDGQLSTSVSMKLSHLRGNLSQWSKQRAAVRADVGKVLWQATNIVEGTER